MRTVYDSRSGLPTLLVGALGITGVATIGWAVARTLVPQGGDRAEGEHVAREVAPAPPPLARAPHADPFAPPGSVAVAEIVEHVAPVAAPAPPVEVAIDAAPPLPSKEGSTLEDDESDGADAPPTGPRTFAPSPRVRGAAPTDGVAALVATRGRTSSANERARSIARTTALRHFAQDPSSSAHRSPSAVASSPTAFAGSSPNPAVVADPSTGLEIPGVDAPEDGMPALGGFPLSDAGVLEPEDRSLLFVWDLSIATDAERTRELLDFAILHRFSALAIDATAIGYGDATVTGRVGALTSEARQRGIESFALIGYPWFAVSSAAQLPGQPTHSGEGLAMIETIVATGLFDGLVEDSHPYGVEYDEDGSTRNWLFDEPDRAAADLAAYLDAAQVLLGDLELLKTTPFWYDSDERLVDVRDASGASLGTVAHVVADHADTAVVLAYRDALDGPNGLLELAAGEVEIGPAIVAVECGDLGGALDFLTYHEEGFDRLTSDLDAVRAVLGASEGFRGVGVHHYEPFVAMSGALHREHFFGFEGIDAVSLARLSVVDSYDSRVGSYGNQLGYVADLGRFVSGDEAAVLSNGAVEMASRAVLAGDLRALDLGALRIDEGARVTGETAGLVRELLPPGLEGGDASGADDLRLERRQRLTIGGDQAVGFLDLQAASRLTIVGPARIVVRAAELQFGAAIAVDASFGPVEIHVVEDLTLREFSAIAATDASPASVRLTLGGALLHMRILSAIAADVVAPEATLRMEAYAHLYGRAQARELDVRDAAGLHLDRALFDVSPPR
ncbi:MAG: hypothetical protein AAGB93_03420 [Planctomycetota bacterium]